MSKVPIKNKLKNKPGAKTKLKNNTKNKPGVKKDLVSEILGNM